MEKREALTVIEGAALSLRKLALELPAGTLIGSEEALIARLGCSRSTVRQVARLLEREGLLKVRRGINGGYFCARPDAGTIEATVSTYLETLEMDTRDITVVASALWVEAMRKAAAADRQSARALSERMMAKVKAVKQDAPFAKVRELELLTQAEVFALAQSPYVKLIFDINVAFSRRKFSAPMMDDTSEDHFGFVAAWKESKMLELSAIGQGDVELAGMAAHYSRKIWHRRVLSRFA